MSDVVITAKIGGRQLRLSTPKQWRAAIANQDIGRDSAIRYEPGLGRQADMLAGECPELIPLFDEILGPIAGEAGPASVPLPPPSALPEPAPVASPSVPSAQPSDFPADLPAKVQSIGVDPSESDDEIGEKRVPETSEPEWSSSPTGEGTGAKVVLTIIALVLLLAIVRCSTDGSSSPTPVATEAVASEATSEAPVDDPSTWQTMYGVSPLNVRSEPNGTAKLVASLPRSTELVGVIVQGGRDNSTNWFLIKKGPHTGRYVSAVNLSDSAPPDIDASTAGDYYVLYDEAPLVSPNSSSTTISDPKQKFRANQKVKTNGTIGAYAEVGLNRGGVGYLPTADLSTTKPESTESTADEGDGEEDPISHPNTGL